MINQQYQNVGNFMPNRNSFNPYFNTTNPAGVSTPINNIIQVQGVEGAKAYQLNPNSMAILLDSEAEAEEIYLELNAIDFDINDIITQQDEIYKKYKKKLKEITLC